LGTRQLRSSRGRLAFETYDNGLVLLDCHASADSLLRYLALAWARLPFDQYNLGRYPDAAGLYRKLIDEYPGVLDYQTGYAWALQRMGKRKEARAIFQTMLAVSPDNVNAQEGLKAE
jgi:tetratricopeptide (TPR) repeat protein